MKRHPIFAAFLVLSVWLPLAACKRGEHKAELPPPTGAGAAPMPELPVIGADDKAGAQIAPTEGKTTGTTVAHAEAQVAANATGVLVSVPGKEGDHVKKGDVLFKQDSRDAYLRVQQAQVAVKAAKVSLDAAKADWDRSKAMADQGAMVKAQWDQVDARYQGAKVGVEQAQVALSMALKAADDTIGRSPIDGVIAVKLHSDGDMATMMPPTIVEIVRDVSVLDLHVRLPESALVDVKPGSALTAKFVAVGLTREGKVVRVAPEVDARSRTVEVIVELPNADGSLKPGLLAEVTMAKESAKESAKEPVKEPAKVVVKP